MVRKEMREFGVWWRAVYLVKPVEWEDTGMKGAYAPPWFLSSLSADAFRFF